MLHRVVPMVRNVAKVPQLQLARCMGGAAHKSNLEIAMEARTTINDLPVPQGSWHEDYKQRQTKYNFMLGGNVIIFLFTMYYTFATGVFVWNDAPDYKKIVIDMDE